MQLLYLRQAQMKIIASTIETLDKFLMCFYVLMKVLVLYEVREEES